MPPKPIALFVDPCLGDLARDVSALATLETGRQVILTNQSDDAKAVRITCTSTGFRITSAADAAIGAGLQKRVAWNDVDPRVKARVVALALAEALDDEAPPAPTATNALAAAAAPAQREAPTAPSHEHISLMARAHARGFAEGSLGLGGGLAVRFSTSPKYALWLDASAEAAQVERRPGTVSLSVAALGAKFGFDPALSESRRWTLGVMGGVDVGYLRAVGSPETSAFQGGDLSAPWVAAVARLQVRVRLSTSTALNTGVDLGWPFITIKGTSDGSDERVWSGPYAVFGVGFELRLR